METLRFTPVMLSNSTSTAAEAHTVLSYVSLASSFILLPSLTALAYLIHQDYLKFKSLGPGGTPSTWLGYIKIKFLSLFMIHNPYMPPDIPPEIYLNRSAYLTKTELPARKGSRPVVRGIAPHRQLDQRPRPEVFAALKDEILAMGKKWPRRLRHGTSCLEKHGPGLFALKPINQSRHCSGEICHAHPSDGSMHLTLHPADAAIVILRGWGERHPLSSGGWLARFVPQGFVMVYAPRTEEEVQIVRKIVAAAGWWVGGVDVDEKFGKELEEMIEGDMDEQVKVRADGPACQVPVYMRGANS
jgi:hypothetical protein